MEKKKVSIVLPVYNGETFLAEAINSVMKQSYSNWELVVVNDCSTDRTSEICEKYSERDSRIKIINNEQNLKLPNSLNVGFRNATGDYYTWTSDDNILRTNAISTLVDALDTNPDVDMVYANYIKIDEEGNEVESVELQDPQFIVTDNVYGACFLYTADIAKKVGDYDADLFLAEDYDYWMRIYSYGKVKHILDFLYCYRNHGGSLTETKKASIKEQTYRAIEKNFLPLYTDAKSHGLAYAFFDQVLVRAEAHVDETKRMLLAVDNGYEHFLKKRNTKVVIKEKIRSTALYRILRKLKGISC